MPRILFVTTKIGFGHERISRTLESAIKNSIPECDTKTVTYFDFFPPRFQKLINTIYIYGLRLFPNVFGYIYLTQKRYKGRGIDFWYRILGRKYAELIKNYSPNLIIITQGLACQWLGRLKERGLIDCKLAAIVTDFIVHPFWVSHGIDIYILATEEMKNDLVMRGVPSKRIKVTGIPIDPKFNIIHPKNQIKNKLGLAVDKNLVLIMGGGWGLGGIDRIVRYINKIDLPLELLVVTGKNRGLYRKLKNEKFRLPVYIYGKVDNIHELMAASNIIITKTGGVTVSELLASSLPAILWDIIPGQEEANAEYLTKNGVAVKIKSLSNLKDTLRRMILSPKIRNENLGRPNSTMDAVKHITEIINV